MARRESVVSVGSERQESLVQWVGAGSVRQTEDIHTHRHTHTHTHTEKLTPRYCTLWLSLRHRCGVES